MNVDLNLSNYSLEDLLSLFKIERLNEDTLKQCYHTAVMTHPDKSGLDKSIFIFFSKAFKMLKNVFMYKIGERHDTSVYNSGDYHDIGIDDASQKRTKMSKEAFNTWFNEAFDKLPSFDEELNSGYNDWFNDLKSGEEVKFKSLSDMHDHIHDLKNNQHGLIKYDDPESLVTCGYSIVRERVSDYSSDVFSKLQYNDLKKSQVETVIPVTNKDMPKHQFENVNAIKTFRENQYNNSVFNTKDDSVDRETESVNIGFKLAKQMEKTKEINRVWRSSLHQLEYS